VLDFTGGKGVDLAIDSYGASMLDRIFGMVLGHVDQSSAEWEAGVAHCLKGLSEGWLKVPIEGVFPLAQAADMHRRLEGRQVAGKLLLKTA
jgi:NADPH2:quinone reductase